MAIQKKECKGCKIKKSIDEFGKKPSGQYGVEAYCKQCRAMISTKYYIENKERILAKRRIDYKKNIGKIKARDKKYYIINRDNILLKKQIYAANNKEKISKQRIFHHANNKEQISLRRKEYRVDNLCDFKQKDREYYKKNRIEILKRANVYYDNNKDKIFEARKRSAGAVKEKLRFKYKSDPFFRLNCSFSSAIYNALKHNKNWRRWESLVGYTAEKLKGYLEKQFTDGMKWDNYGRIGWTVDHKIPISVFNYTKPEHEDFKRCWSLENLQPMWFKENISKGAKLEKHFQPQLAMG